MPNGHGAVNDDDDSKTRERLKSIRERSQEAAQLDITTPAASSSTLSGNQGGAATVAAPLRLRCDYRNMDVTFTVLLVRPSWWHMSEPRGLLFNHATE